MLSFKQFIYSLFRIHRGKHGPAPRAEIIRRNKPAETKSGSDETPDRGKGGKYAIIVFTLLLMGVSPLHSQWTQTNLTGAINSLFHDGTNLFAATNAGVLRSNDNGTNWNGENTGLTNLSARAFTTNGSDIFLATFSGGIYRSANGPSWNWSQLQSGSFHCLYNSGSTIFAGSMGGGVYVSNNNGATWTTSNTGLTDLTVWAIHGTGTAIYAGTLGGVFKSTDNGATWAASNSGITSLDIRAIISVGSTLFCGRIGGGIYRSTDAGATWSFVAGGSVDAFAITCGTDIYAGATNMGGISKSTDNGLTWTGDNTGLTNNSVTALASSSNHLFAGTFGGVFKKEVNCPVNTSCITWDLMQSGAVTSSSTGMNGSTEVIGAGTSTPFMSVFTPYTTNGQRLWCGNTGWVAGSLDPNRYIEFSVTPSPGGTITINTVSFNYGDNPLTTNFNILSSQVYYSTDGWSTSTQLGGTLSYLNTAMQTFNQTIPGGVTVVSGQSFSVRIYPYSTVGSSPMSPSFAIHNNVQMCGSVSTGPPNTASICGTKFNDLNGNGIMDPNEPGLPGWQIGLGIATVPYAVTDANGDYCFTNLPAGNYTVSEVQQPGWIQTFPASPGTHSVTLATGQQLENVNFGNMRATLNCDSLSATAVKTNPDDCNWVLSLNQPAILPGIASVQVLCLLPNQFTTGTGLGTNYQNWLTSGNNIFTPPSGLVPGGNLTNFFNMSVLFVTTPQLIVVNWIDTLGNIACSDTVELDCHIACTTIIEDTVTCNDGNPILKFRFRNDADFNMKNIQYTVVSPSGVTVNPSNVTLTTPVNPGQISGLQSIIISGAAAGDTVSLSVKFTSSDGCCWCYGTIKVVIPDCFTFCDSLGVTATGNPKNCSYDISLVNNSTMVFSSVQFELVSGGVFTNFTASTTGWGFTNVWPNNSITLVKMPISTGIGQGTYNNVLNMSISQYTNPVQTIVVRWIKNGVVMCTDTLRFSCIPTVPPDNDCSQIIDQTVTCRADGSFMFKFRVQNNSNIISTGYGINPTTPGVTFSKTLVNNVTILPGQVSPFDSLIITGIAPNSSLCFQTAIFTTVVPGDTVYNFCCHSDTMCVTTPDCGLSDFNDTGIPTHFGLSQNYPNPFNPSTMIGFSIAESGQVRLAVFDILGSEVAVLVDEYKPAGRYTVKFDASGLNSGLYIYQINSGSFMEARKLILLK